MRTILGINSAYHESSVCLVQDGRLLAFAEEERFNRRKHAKPARVDNPDVLPLQALAHCLKQAGIALSDVEAIGYSFNPPRRLRNLETGEPFLDGDWGSPVGEQLFQQKLAGIPEALGQLAGTDLADRFFWLDHHLCHAASAFFVSPFPEAAVLSVDGIGEFSTIYLGHGRDTRLHRVQLLDYPDSIGFLWEKLSKFLGFSEYDACKVMGLASYGDPARYRPAMDSFVACQPDGTFRIDPQIAQFRVEDSAALESLLGPRRQRQEPLEPRHSDIAAALQATTEDLMLGLAELLRRKTDSPRLCLAGGVALNCTANRRIQESGLFDEIYIQPAANDAGTAIGAAYLLWHQKLDQPRGYVLDAPYLGPEYTEAEMVAALQRRGLPATRHENIEQVAANLLAEGQIVAWFQGRMEAGPRALGNRSLLADPRRPEMREILNQKVKHREDFRPFAPSVLEERAKEWFKLPATSLSSDFMLFAYEAIPEQAPRIPAVLHVDGTSRIQTVRRATAPRYWKLLSAFEALTGVPLLLNTSFNDQEPIVCSPDDAVATFLKTRIDALVLGDHLVLRKDLP